MRMVILNRSEASGEQPPHRGQGGQPNPVGQEYFGAVGRIDEGKIILAGPRFRVTARHPGRGQQTHRTGQSAGGPVGGRYPRPP
ncbi:MAG: hypothetical protein FJY95_09000 [Candidatus Handelsmanbacteria bacterium]|nr:hypothetical protein [Candidatus Handelsmanbacteria bacterium]